MSSSISALGTHSASSSHSCPRPVQPRNTGCAESTIMKVTGVALTGLGIGLCCTGPGAVVGVPFVLFGIIAIGAPTCVDCVETINRNS